MASLQLSQPLATGLSSSNIGSLLPPTTEGISPESQAQIQLLLIQILSQLKLKRECISTLEVLQREKTHWDYKEDQLEERLFNLKKEKRLLEGSIADLQYENQQLRNGKCNVTDNCPEVSQKRISELQRQMKRERERSAELEAQLNSQSEDYDTKINLAEREIIEIKEELEQEQRRAQELEEKLEKCSSEPCVTYVTTHEDFDVRNKTEEFFDYLEKNEIDVNSTISDRNWKPLHLAAAYGDPTIIEVILERGADVNAADINDLTPLMLAAFRGKLQALQILLSRGAIVNLQDSSDMSALHRAAYRGHADVIRELFNSGGPDINVANGFGDFPLHQAAHFNHTEAVEALLESGVPVDPLDKNNQTPLHNAAARGNLEIVKLLIDNKADVSVQNSAGLTPLDLATDENNLDVVAYLKKASNTA